MIRPKPRPGTLAPLVAIAALGLALIVQWSRGASTRAEVVRLKAQLELIRAELLAERERSAPFRAEIARLEAERRKGEALRAEVERLKAIRDEAIRRRDALRASLKGAGP